MPVNQERIRFRYGICLNDKCEKCKSKEVQEIPTRKELVCPVCGKPLHECPPPKRGGNKWLYGVAGIIGLLLIGGLVWWLMGSEKEPQPQQPNAAQVADSLRRDSLEKASKAAAAQATADSLSNSASKAQQERDSLQALADSLQHVANEQKAAPSPAPAAPAAAASAPKSAPKPAPAPAATSGSKNLGYATFKGTWPNDVNGRLVFKTSHVIDSRDPKGRIAEPGDYVIGEFSEGHLVQGIWYSADNQVKGSIIIGK